MKYLCHKWPRICSTCRKHFSHSGLITGFVTRLTRRVPLVEQELPTLPEHLSSLRFLLGSWYSIFSFMCMFCRSLFVLLYFFFWPLCCLFFFDLRILITPSLVSSKSFSKVLRSSPWLGWPLRNSCVTNDHGYVPLVANTSRSFPHSWLITGFVTKVTQRVSLVEQEILTLPGYLRSPPRILVGFLLIDL
jgi:hypothetical protein